MDLERARFGDELVAGRLGVIILRAADADIDLETDAAERLDELDGIAFSEDELR